MTIITRRQALTRLGATSAAVTLGGGSAAWAGVATPAAPAGTAIDRIEKLGADLARALDEFCGDQFKAVVYPTSHPLFPAQLHLLSAIEPSPAEAVEYHLARAVDAASQLSGRLTWDVGPWHYRANTAAALAIRTNTIGQDRPS